MGVSKKGRRSIWYKDMNFVWWVGPNEDFEDQIWLNIISEDKSIVLAYRVEGGDFYIVTKGRIFQGEKKSGFWESYWYPMEEPPMVVTPKFVSEVIAWAVDGRGAERCNKSIWRVEE